ncbi:MAG: hypothetical protein ACD_79C01067G0001 [uncultured bacterium]|nr:MAG: hypothetical protein ACD_79C01067G0001 [uncultured bacterium]
MTLPVGSNTFVAHVTEPLYGMESAKSDPYYHTIAESNVFSIVNKLTNETIYISYNPDTMTTTILPRQNFPSDPLTNFAEQSLMAKVPFSYFDDGKAAVSKQEIFNDPINSFIGKSVKNEKASGITDELGVLLDVFRLHRNVLRSLEKFNKSNNKEFNYYTRLFNPLNELKNKYFILAEGADEFARTSAEKEIILFKRALEKRKGEAFDMRAARALFVIWHESDTQGPESHDFVIPRDIKRLEYLEREFKVDIKQLLSVTGMEYYKKIWESKNFHYQMQKMFQGENRLYKIHKGNVKNSDIPAVVVIKANQILNNRSDLITDIGYHLRHSDVNKNKLVIQITSDITDAKKAPEVVEKIAKMLKDEGVPQSAYEFRYDSTESIAGILNYKNIPLNRITILFDEGEGLNQEILNSKVNKLRYSPIKPCQMVLAVYFAKTGKIDFDKVPPEENSREKMDKKDKNKIKKPEKPVYAFLKEFLRKNPDGSYSFFDKVTGPNPYGPMNRSA